VVSKLLLFGLDFEWIEWDGVELATTAKLFEIIRTGIEQMELDENPSNQGNVFGGQLGSAAVGASQSSMKFDLVVKFFNKFGETKGKDKSKLTRTFIGLLFKENRRP